MKFEYVNYWWYSIYWTGQPVYYAIVFKDEGKYPNSYKGGDIYVNTG